MRSVPRKRLPSRIYLTGFMGSGKSTIGPILAERLDYDFVDLDLQIEWVVQKPIVAIFEEDGEAAFRALEADVFKETMSLDHLVVATGGGTLLNQEFLRLAKSAGVVVYLRLAAKALAVRLKGMVNRPIMQDQKGGLLSESALLVRIEALLTERGPFYEQADFIVEADGLSPEVVVEAIVGALNERA